MKLYGREVLDILHNQQLLFQGHIHLCLTYYLCRNPQSFEGVNHVFTPDPQFFCTKFLNGINRFTLTKY